ncbi:hypothetical protein SUGI_0415400 [Cryptomeria japonica]|nr:hypothetical protein SUGI_0415400 [Cryptomeria japonica]
MVRHNCPADMEFNCLEFFSSHEMQTSLSENLFVDALMEDDYLPALLGLSPNLLHQTSRPSGSEVFPLTEHSNGNLAGDLQQGIVAWHNAPQSAVTSQCNLTGIEPATCALPAIPSDLAFVERAAKYSSFVEECSPKAEESAGIVTNGNGRENASASGVSGNEVKYGCRKKRKNVVEAVSCDALKGKRCKSAESEKDAFEDSKRKADQSNNSYCTGKVEDARNVKAPALPDKKDYIHVRARRGQATDSHSLAERARREKISKRMKVLQDLVPGCSKSTSKALMLDEIINHVQSLQRQVEFLSMKLATCSPIVDIDMYRFSR